MLFTINIYFVPSTHQVFFSVWPDVSIIQIEIRLYQNSPTEMPTRAIVAM